MPKAGRQHKRRKPVEGGLARCSRGHLVASSVASTVYKELWCRILTPLLWDWEFVTANADLPSVSKKLYTAVKSAALSVYICTCRVLALDQVQVDLTDFSWRQYICVVQRANERGTMIWKDSLEDALKKMANWIDATQNIYMNFMEHMVVDRLNNCTCHLILIAMLYRLEIGMHFD